MRPTVSTRSTPPATDHVAFGAGVVETACVGGRSNVVRLSSRAPLKLLTPRTRGLAATVFTSTYGGGLLANDTIALNVRCGPETALVLRTQSATKVYRSADGSPASQKLAATVDADATLVSLPDPVTCFAGAAYEQRQSIDLAAGASLLLLDGYTAGRSARGESWAFDRYHARAEIRRLGRPIFADALRLDRADDSIAKAFRGGRFACVSMLVLLGPTFADRAADLRKSIDASPVARQGDLLAVASPIERLGESGLVVRVASTSTELTSEFLKDRLGFLSELVGHQPFGRKW